MGHKGGTRSDTELNQWVTSEKEALANVMGKYDIEWEQKGTHKKHLSLLNFEKQERAKEVAELEKVKAELEELNALVAKHTDEGIEYLENIEADVQKELVKKEEAEKEAKKAEKKWMKYEKKLSRYINVSQNVKVYAGEFSRPEELVPDPDFLESAKSYRERKIIPFMLRIKDLLLGLYRAYLDMQKEMEKVELRNERLENSNAYLSEKNQNLEQCIEKMAEDVHDYRRLRRVVGEEHSDAIVQGERNREIEEINSYRILRKRHDRDAR